VVWAAHEISSDADEAGPLAAAVLLKARCAGAAYRAHEEESPSSNASKEDISIYENKVKWLLEEFLGAKGSYVTSISDSKIRVAIAGGVSAGMSALVNDIFGVYVKKSAGQEEDTRMSLIVTVSAVDFRTYNTRRMYHDYADPRPDPSIDLRAGPDFHKHPNTRFDQYPGYGTLFTRVTPIDGQRLLLKYNIFREKALELDPEVHVIVVNEEFYDNMTVADQSFCRGKTLSEAELSQRKLLAKRLVVIDTPGIKEAPADLEEKKNGAASSNAAKATKKLGALRATRACLFLPLPLLFPSPTTALLVLLFIASCKACNNAAGDIIQCADVHLFLIDGSTGHLDSESNKQAVKAYCIARGAAPSRTLTKGDWEGDSKTFWLTTKMDRCNDHEFNEKDHRQGWELVFPVKEGLCEVPKGDTCFLTAIGDQKKMESNFARIREVNKLKDLYVRKHLHSLCFCNSLNMYEILELIHASQINREFDRVHTCIHNIQKAQQLFEKSPWCT
jgi:hypothetical protein